MTSNDPDFIAECRRESQTIAEAEANDEDINRFLEAAWTDLKLTIREEEGLLCLLNNQEQSHGR